MAKNKEKTTATQAEESLTQEQAAAVETQTTATGQADEQVDAASVELAEEKPEAAPAEPAAEQEEETPEAVPAEQADQATPPDSGKKSGKKKTATLPDFLAPYIRAYPKNKTFHVTSDRMVFLAGDRGLAVVHQKSLKGGEVTTYNV